MPKKNSTTISLRLFPDRRWIPLVLTIASVTLDMLMMQEFHLDQVLAESRQKIAEALPVVPAGLAAAAAAAENSGGSWYYVDHLPAPGQPWPTTSTTTASSSILQLLQLTTQAATKTTTTTTTATSAISDLTLTTGIPALYNERVQAQLPNVLLSIAAQTVLPDEVVIVMSQVVDPDLPDGTALCEVLYEWVQLLLRHNNNNDRTKVRTRLLCVGERLTAGRARNAVGKLATSDIVSFVDSDDTELPHRNAVTKHHFACHRDRLQMVLHQYTADREQAVALALQHQQHIQQQDDESVVCPPNGSFGDQVALGSQLHDMLQTTHERWWLRKELAHGHMVVRRSVLDQIHFASMFKGEDANFVRDVLFAFGRNDDAVVYLEQPLTSYFKSNRANKDLLVQKKR